MGKGCGYAPMTLLAAATQAAHKAAHQTGDPLAFYSVVATLIRVLFIAVAFEAKGLGPARRRGARPVRAAQPAAAAASLVSTAVWRSSVCWWPSRA
jgi:hypothetical protein